MFYLDTALIVAALTDEKASQRAQLWFDQHREARLFVSAWVSTEFAAALAIKLQAGDLSEPTRQNAERGYLSLQDSTVRLEITSDHFERASQMARVHQAGLRGGDALHLAIAMASNATLCTLDKKFAGACRYFAVPCQLI